MKRQNLSRRQLLKSAGALLLARPARAAVSPMMTRLSEFMAAAASAPLPPEVVEKTKHMILDTFAAMISGADLPPGKYAIQFARSYGGEKQCTVAASNVLCGPVEAALANGMLAHSDETDDTHPPSQSHPGASVVPSALAMGEKFGVDGTRTLRAVTLGYDIGTRFTATLGKLQYMNSTHRSTHTLSGTFGSSAAAGCCAGLNAQQMRWLLSYAAQQASGLASWQRDSDHIEKAFDFGGMPARNGVTAALMVKAGGTGVDDILSGTDNVFQAFQPMNDPSMFVDKLSERYEITRTNVKKWTVGAPIQAPLDALEAILQKSKLKADQISRVSIRVAAGEASIVNNREIPDISLQHLISVMLVDGTVTFKSAHDEARMKDAVILKHRAKVQLVPDEGLEKLMPKRIAIVDVTGTDGKIYSERVEAVRGTADNPMPRAEIIAKARDLIVPVLGADKSQKLIDKVMGIEGVKSALEFRPLLQR